MVTPEWAANGLSYSSKAAIVPVDPDHHLLDIRRQPKAASKRPGLCARTRIAILLSPRLFAGYVLLTQEILLVAGAIQARSVDVMGSRFFDTDMLSVDGTVIQSFGDMPMPAAAALTNTAYDVVIAPVQSAPGATLDAEEVHIADWLRMRYEAGALVVDVNTASLFAKAGLPDDCRVTGLASKRAWLVRHFSNVHYTPDRPLVVDGRIVTVSGISPAVGTCAYVIDYYRRAGASQRMSRTALTQSPSSYEYMAVWMAQFERHGDMAMLTIREIVERELTASSALAELAVQVAMSERSLTCRFAAAAGSNLRRHMVTLRLGLAAFLPRTGRQPPDHIADECGYGSASTLSRVFSAGHGCSPFQYRARHHTC